MSVDQPTTSFGDPTARPPTPKQTPSSTTSFFPSPVFETPRTRHDHHASTSTTTPGPEWTPRFAEDFSVFNTTPGNLRGSNGPFGDYISPFTPPTIQEPSHGGPPPSASSTATRHHKRPLSIGSFAVEIATHVNHFPSNPNLPLPPVDRSRQLSSSPGLVVTSASAATGSTESDEKSSDGNTRGSPNDTPETRRATEPFPGSPRLTRSAKKARHGSTSGLSGDKDSLVSSQGQTATPPPSARKSGRKIAPRLQTDKMQSDQGYGHPQQHHPDFVTTPHQAHMNGYVTSPADMFGYPMSAPATASAFADARNFWAGGDPNMTAMDIDYSAAGSNVFQTPTPVHRQMESMDWAQASQASQMFMANGGAGPGTLSQQHQHQHHQELEHMQQMAQATCDNSKQMMMAGMQTTSATEQQAVFAGSYQTSIDDPFGIVSPGGGVNPGLLFTRPPSSSMDAIASPPQGHGASLMSASPMGYNQPRQLSSASQGSMQMSQGSPPQGLMAVVPTGVRKELRRSASVKDLAPRRKAGDRTLASSPVKTMARPGLSRSFSESRGPKLRGRASLPTLAPAIKPLSPLSVPQPPGSAGSATGLGITRSTTAAGARRSGRISPVKSLKLQQQDEQQHQRLSSLTSIPEVNTPRRASVKFTIDANGRARVETKADGEADLLTPQSTLRRNQSARSLHSKSRWESSSDDDSSSTDDEPIIIPSRTTSFALPDPIRPSIGRGPLHSSQRSVSDRSTASTYTTPFGDHDMESEAETVLTDLPKGAGDAASELEKLLQHRQKRANGISSVPGSAQKGLRFGGPLSGNGSFHKNGFSAISPTTMTEVSLPTPSSDSRSFGVRCVCGLPNAPGPDDGFVVQCESCEMWLHGRCINITKRTLPSVYICAYCAQTPNVQRMRMQPPSIPASSPLAHKSFKKFR